MEEGDAEPRPEGSAKGAARTSKRIRNRPAPRSVLREFLRSAKGAARTSKRIRNRLAPRSVLREFLRSAPRVQNEAAVVVALLTSRGSAFRNSYRLSIFSCPARLA